MKKIMALMLALVLCLSVGTVALAEDQVDAQVDTQTAISILLNNQPISAGDVAPLLHEGRTMIPFRAVLEAMGASVTYDEATAVAGATKGDVTISFSTTGTEVKILENGEERTITMDVAPIVVEEGRTLVPVRFLAESLGMKVGWDDTAKTVLVEDFDVYFDKFEKAAPDLFKLLDLSATATDTEYTTNTKMTMDYAMKGDSIPTPQSLKLDITADDARNGAETKGSAVVNFAQTGLDELFTTLGISLPELKGVTFDTLMANKTFYLKTNMVAKLLEANPDNQMIQAASSLMGQDDMWFSFGGADVDRLFPADSSMGAMAPSLKLILEGNTAMMDADGFRALMEETLGADLSSVAMAQAIDSAFDTYYDMFSAENFKLTEQEDGSYKLVCNYTLDEETPMPDGATAVKNVVAMTINADIVNGIATKQTAEVTVTTTMGTAMDMSVKIAVETTTALDATVEKVEAPMGSIAISAIVATAQALL